MNLNNAKQCLTSHIFQRNKCDALIKDLMFWVQGFKLNCFPQQLSFTMNIGKMKYALEIDIISSRNKVNIAKATTNLAIIYTLGKTLFPWGT